VLVDPTDAVFEDHRIRTIQALVDFCKVQEAPRRRRLPSSCDWGLVAHCGPGKAEAPKPPPNPQSCLTTQCIFYLRNPKLPLETQLFCFCRPRKAREHVENVHLRHLNAHDPLDCPLCGKVLEGIMHFKNHAASEAHLTKHADGAAASIYFPLHGRLLSVTITRIPRLSANTTAPGPISQTRKEQIRDPRKLR
jgi:hypothetical protein